MYIDDDYNGGKKKLRMDVPNDQEFDGLSIGDKVKVNITGTVQSLEGPHDVPDYDYEPKRGEKRRMKRRPGNVCIEIDSDPEMGAIKDLNDMHLAEEVD